MCSGSASVLGLTVLGNRSLKHSTSKHFIHDYWVNIRIYSRKISSEIKKVLSTDAPYNSSSTERASKFKRLTTANSSFHECYH